MKDLLWISSSKKDLLKFSEEIIDSVGYALYLAQTGRRYKNTKTLKGFGGSDIIEIIESDESGTYRVIYCIKMPKAILVLHAFQKKSKQGIKTPKEEIDLIKSRLKLGLEKYKEIYKNEKK